jgi:hypothetical protein
MAGLMAAESCVGVSQWITREVGMDPGLQERHRAEVIGAYKASVRLRLYARMSGMAGIVAAIGVFGAMIVGGIGVEEGVTGIVLSLLLTLASAAKFYDASYRTGIGASAIERSLGLDEDLFGQVSETREKLVTWTTIAVVAGGVAIAAILAISFANAGTERDDDDDDDDDKTEESMEGFRRGGDDGDAAVMAAALAAVMAEQSRIQQ